MPQKVLRVPFQKESPHHLIPQNHDTRRENKAYLWCDNYIFDDGLAVVGVDRSERSYSFLLESVNDGRQYRLLSSELLLALSLARLEHRLVEGISQPILVAHWTFCKKGTAYSVKAVDVGPSQQV